MILSFEPNDLSSLAGQIGLPDALWVTPQSFNLNDLPCPPKSVASRNWWKAAPGEPYRPLVQVPQTLAQIFTEFSRCNLGWFTFLDPPKPLTPETAMVSKTASPISSQSMQTLDSNVLDANVLDGSDQSSLEASPVGSPDAGLPRKTSLTPTPNPKDHEGVDPVNLVQGIQSTGSPQIPSQHNDVGLHSGFSVDVEDGAPSGATQQTTAGGGNDQLRPGGEPQDMDNGNEHRDSSPAVHSQPNQDKASSIIAIAPYGSPIQDNGATESHNGVSGNAVSVSGESNAQKLPDRGNLGDAIIAGIQAAIEPAESDTWSFEVPKTHLEVDGQMATPAASVPTSQENVNAGMTDGKEGEESYSNADTPEGNYEGGFGTHTTDPVNIAGLDIKPVSNGVRVDGSILTPGISAITVSGTPVSLGSSVFIYGTKTIPYTPPTPAAPAADPPMTTIADQIIAPVPNGNGISIAGTTLTPGAPGITISGRSVSLGSSAFVIGTDTIPYILPSKGAAASIVIAGEVVKPLPERKGVFIAGTTLTPGENAVISGTALSIASDAVIVSGSTFTVSFPTESDAEKPFITTLGSQVLTADASAIAFNGTSIIAGAHALTVDGQILSFGTDDDLIIGSSTLDLGGHDFNSGTSSQTSPTNVNDYNNPSSLSTQQPSVPALLPAGQTTRSGGTTGQRTHRSGAVHRAGLYGFCSLVSMIFVTMIVAGFI